MRPASMNLSFEPGLHTANPRSTMSAMSVALGLHEIGRSTAMSPTSPGELE